MTVVSYDWPGQLNQILADTSLNADLSDEAIKVITDYMISGIDNPVNIPKTGILPLEAVYGMGVIVSMAGVMFGRKRRIHRI
jgi:hypothetical protein